MSGVYHYLNKNEPWSTSFCSQ